MERAAHQSEKQKALENVIMGLEGTTSGYRMDGLYDSHGAKLCFIAREYYTKHQV